MMRTSILSFGSALALTLVLSCTKDHIPSVSEPTSFQASAYASGLKAPIGMTLDNKGQIWVTEGGLGKDDASVSVITTDGKVSQVITGFKSEFANGAIEGMGHVIFKEGKLYILNGLANRLYIADVSSYKTGDQIALGALESQDLGTFIDGLKLVTPLNSNVFNMTFGPDGHLYILDAGSNAIIKRDQTTKELSLFARIPNVTQNQEPVPTSIVYDGSKFLLTTFSGGPFFKGTAKIFQVDKSGKVDDYKTNLTTLTSIVLTPNNKPLVTEFAEFSLTQPGFVAGTGRVANEDGVTLFSGLTMPTDLERSGDKTYYVLSNGTGTVQKLTY
ncbi:ScyD/ScyE family protein [Dyadobacter psychrotolerans]|uniref:ScyD/ScyE family protein n=1 Tax=Dyadobacter psychrotolerans TaxID=2541721 RepID=A0A4R5DTG9_9BACT|nr:ScyD/ScyE family protein [Dyadobacter psychrotolerans]TDE15590.1 ScyD/ScyE family protein [Dyadobacter psychrotolerans]